VDRQLLASPHAAMLSAMSEAPIGKAEKKINGGCAVMVPML
jgi:hypothetical protein